MKVYMSFVAAPEKWMADAYSCARNFLVTLTKNFPTIRVFMHTIV